LLKTKEMLKIQVENSQTCKIKIWKHTHLSVSFFN